MSDLPLEAASLLVAAILFAAHFAAEALVRRGRAKSMVRTPFEGHSTLLVTALGLAAVVVAAAARPLPSWGRFAPRPGVLALLGLGMLAGVALRYWSMLTLGERFTRTLTVLPDHAVVTRGPYRWIRHPGYLAQILVLTAGAALLSLDRWLPLLVAAVLFGAYAQRIRAEESMLAARLGAEYASYRARTWRLIPFVY
jgi:protein-S-isoprenylcysteine O-methyltransferase Ste14